MSTIVSCSSCREKDILDTLHHWEHISYSVWMAFDLAHIIHYLLIHRPLGFLPFHPFKSILQNPVVSVGWGFLQSGNSSNHLRLSFSLSLHVLNPPLVTSHGAPICAVIRPSPACRLGRNIIKTILCCHGNRDLNKFIFFMCAFSGARLAFGWLVSWLVGWLNEWQNCKLFILSVFSSRLCI